MELTEFLLARIAEDEAAARAATSGPWRYDPGKEWHTDLASLQRARAGQWTPDGEEFVAAGPKVAPLCVAVTGPSDDPESMCDADHIARWDPARVLAECEAKRRIVELHETIRAAYPNTTIETDPCCAECSAGGEYPGRFPCETIRLLALPFASHPDYRSEWAT